MYAKRHAFILFCSMHPDIMTIRALLNGDQLCGHVYVAWPNYSNHCCRQQINVSLGVTFRPKGTQRSIVSAQSSCFNFKTISVTDFNSAGITDLCFPWPDYGYCYSFRESKCLNGPNRSFWSIVLVIDDDCPPKIFFNFWVILSVRLGDLITLLIIAKGGQCKDVYVPENVQLWS